MICVGVALGNCGNASLLCREVSIVIIEKQSPPPAATPLLADNVKDASSPKRAGGATIDSPTERLSPPASPTPSSPASPRGASSSGSSSRSPSPRGLTRFPSLPVASSARVLRLSSHAPEKPKFIVSLKVTRHSKELIGEAIGDNALARFKDVEILRGQLVGQ